VANKAVVNGEVLLMVNSPFPFAPKPGDEFEVLPPDSEIVAVNNSTFGRNGTVAKLRDNRLLPLVGGDDLDKHPCDKHATRESTTSGGNNMKGFGPQLWVLDSDGWFPLTQSQLKADGFGDDRSARVRVFLDIGVVVLADQGDPVIDLFAATGPYKAVALRTYFESPFIVSVGPSGSAFENCGFFREMCIRDDDFVHCSQMVEHATPEVNHEPGHENE